MRSIFLLWVGSLAQNMAADESLKGQLHVKLNDFSSLTRRLLEVVHSDKTGFLPPASVGVAGYSSGAVPGVESVSEVLDKLIDCDKEIQKLVDVAMTMRSRQREIEWIDSQLERRQLEIQDLQNRMHEAEKLLEVAVYHGKQKMESIEQAEKGGVEPEVLIRYAHMISQASSVVSPLGWQPNDPRRPFPQDVEMKRGALGKLSVKSNSIKSLADLAVQIAAAESNPNPTIHEHQTFGMLSH